MKFTLLKKILTLLIPLIIVPLCFISFVLISDARNIGNKAITDAKAMGQASIADSTESLKALGQEIIKQKALDLRDEMDQYMADHPTKTLADLQADPVFQTIALRNHFIYHSFVPLPQICP